MWERRAYTQLEVKQPLPDSPVVTLWECGPSVSRYVDFPEELEIQI